MPFKKIGNIEKHSVIINGGKTSVSLEREYWACLRTIATREEVTIKDLVTTIKATAKNNMSSAIRLYILKYLVKELSARLDADLAAVWRKAVA